MTSSLVASPKYSAIPFDQLRGWHDDNHSEALAVFLNTCGNLKDYHWSEICNVAHSASDARVFFETYFQPILIEDGQPMLFTGYYEPEIEGSLQQSEDYQHPIYRLPQDYNVDEPYLTRREIEENRPLSGLGLEIAWLRDPLELFFLQVQGSGRIRLLDGSIMRVGYAGKNGRNYSSIGMALVQRGIFKADKVSAAAIMKWVRDNPDDGKQLLWINESYVFFREVSEVPINCGPLGAMNRSITDLRTVAVDPNITQLGAPVWIEKNGVAPMNSLMIAQDTGSAIKGAQRADVFFGTGNEAGRQAGQIKDGGRMIVLLPIQIAMEKLDLNAI